MAAARPPSFEGRGSDMSGGSIAVPSALVDQVPLELALGAAA